MSSISPPGQQKRGLARILRVIEDWIPGYLLGLTAVIMTADVVARYGFNHPIRGASEVALLAMIWLVYLSAAGVSRRGAHIALDMVSDRLSSRGRAILDIVVELLTLAVLGTLLYAGFLYFATGRFTVLPATGISKGFVTLAIPLSAALMIAHSITHLIRAVRGVTSVDYQRHFEPIEEVELDDFDTTAIRRIDSDISGREPSK